MARSPISGIPDEEYIEDPLAYMAEQANSILPLTRWGFRESYRRFRSYFRVILVYDSEMCRIRLSWTWEREDGNRISITYGRLHAPNEGIEMEWNGERCEAWHWVDSVLFFLDGMRYDTYAHHPILDEFWKSEIFKQFAGKRDGRLGLVYHAFLWERYAPRLFELFDLRRPELWEQYRAFLRDCYVAEGRNEEEDKRKHGALPYYQVC